MMLTTRQREVLALMAQGMTNKEIATALKIIPRTVFLHKAIIRRKLLRSRLGIPAHESMTAHTDHEPPAYRSDV